MKSDDTKRKSDEARMNVMKSVAPLIFKKGVKGLTMDTVAKSLGISKRTLYEIFESKDEMIIAAFTYMHENHRRRMQELLSGIDNVMEAMVKAFRLHLEMMMETGPDLFRDMDEYYPKLRPEFEKGLKNLLNGMTKAFELGVQQGMFRPNINYRIIMRMFLIQMESLRRMEYIFPKDVTLEEIYETMCSAFLRGIATASGLEILEQHTNQTIATIVAPTTE